MGKSYRKLGDDRTFVAPVGGVTVDVPVIIGGALVVPNKTVAVGVTFVGWTRGVGYGFPKKTGFAPAKGDLAYFNNTSHEFEGTDSASNNLVGLFDEAAALNDTTCSVHFSGVPIGAASGDLAEKVNKTDLASTANAKGASLVGVEDVATQYTATTVEGCLTEALDAAQAAQATANAAAPSADLASVVNGKGASLVGVEDAATQYTATTVEGCLTEALDAAQAAQATANAAAPSADLASVVNGKGASLVGVEDAATQYTATTVEGCLTEALDAAQAAQATANAAVPAAKLQFKNVTIALGASTGSSAADPTWVGATLYSCSAVSGNDKPQASMSVAGDGAVTVTTAGNETAEAVFRVLALLAP